MQGLAFRAAQCCDTQVPCDDKDAGDHHSNQDPGTGGEKYVCDIHSDFPLFDLMRIQKPGEPFRRALIRAFHPDQSLLRERFESICVLVDLLMCHL